MTESTTTESINLEHRQLTAKVQLHHYRFPKNKVHESGEYAIVFCEVKELISGEIPDDAIDNKKCICITGKLPKMDIGMEYFFQGTLVKDPKWGSQYNTMVMRLSYNLETPENQRKFFSFFLTSTQIKNLFNAYDNPIKLLADRDIEALTTIKGIGVVTAERLCLKYEENIDNGRAYIELQDLGLTKNAIDKLVADFGSPDVVIEILKKNPYKLISLVKGYGWARTDAIAQRQGFKINSPERVMAFTQYYLYQKANEGHSCCNADELVAAVVQECSPITTDEVVNILKKDLVVDKEFDKAYKLVKNKEKDVVLPEFYYSSSKHQIGTFYLRSVEEGVKRNLIRLKEGKNSVTYDKKTCDEIIQKMEKKNGFNYTIEQQKAIWNVLNNNVSIITGSAGCVDCDTEYFNGQEWKRIADYTPGDKVLMYNPTGTTSLVVPSDYVKYPAKQLWLTQTKYGVDMCLSDEHNVYYVNKRGDLCHTTFENIREKHTNNIYGFSGRFIAGFIGGGKGIDLTDAEIKVMLAVICDGSFTHSSTTLCRFHVKKDRKKQELRKIFKEANLEWREMASSVKGYSDFYIYAPRKEKEFLPYWYNCSQAQLRLICRNILFWDGSVTCGRRSFSTLNKKIADFIQYAFTSCEYKAVIHSFDRRGQKFQVNNKTYEHKKIEYQVVITERNLVGIGGIDKNGQHITEITPYQTKDGFKYCFTVPSHMWVMRRNNRILVTGNTGKSSVLSPLVEIFKHYQLHIAQCALSGRAASLLTEYTNLTGKTIHRLLHYLPETGQFTFNENNKLPYDVIILDETSMVGEELFLSLLSAIKNGSKLILLGDTKQLPPINVGNLLYDMITSGYITTSILTIIQRQAQKSGIISQSLQVCAGKSLCKNDFAGEEVRGELKDFKIVCNSDAMLIHSKAISEFKRLYQDLKVNPDDIQIVVPMRTRGMNSCRFFNAEIQGIVNNDETKPFIEVQSFEGDTRYTVTYRVDDKIMVIHNNYHAKTLKGKETAIFNGNMGHIEDIYNDSMIIRLDKEEDEEEVKIILPRKDWGDITHAWATTCHKCVTEDTWIYTNKGLQQMKDIKNDAKVGEFAPISDSELLVYNGQYYEHPSDFYNAGETDIVKIQGQYGYELKCSLDHHLIVLRDGKEIQIEASEIQQTDKLCIPTNFAIPTVKDSSGCIAEYSSNSNQCLFLQGLFEKSDICMENGHFDRIEFNCKSERMAKQVQLLLQQNGIISSVNHQCMTWKIMIYEKFAEEFLNKIGFINKDKQEELRKVLSDQNRNCDDSQIIITSNMVYLPIKNIEFDKDLTYCLRMPETHLFVQNGILGGNCQGSQFKYVIVVLDNSSFPLLMREWLYTALTRARKYCSLIGQPLAINTATRNSEIKVKQTWLKDELYATLLEEKEQN